jgi:hypothetical protein
VNDPNDPAVQQQATDAANAASTAAAATSSPAPDVTQAVAQGTAAGTTVAQQTAPPETTNWPLFIASGLAVSIVSGLFWMAIEHAGKKVKKENRRLAKRQRR